MPARIGIVRRLPDDDLNARIDDIGTRPRKQVLRHLGDFVAVLIDILQQRRRQRQVFLVEPRAKDIGRHERIVPVDPLITILSLAGFRLLLRVLRARLRLLRMSGGWRSRVGATDA